jgi:hypothetical protein
VRKIFQLLVNNATKQAKNSHQRKVFFIILAYTGSNGPLADEISQLRIEWRREERAGLEQLIPAVYHEPRCRCGIINGAR